VVFVKINGDQHYLWRAVDHEGEIVESYVTKKQNKAAAMAFLKNALKRRGRAETIVTDGMRSCPAAMRELGNLGRREMGRWINNRAKNSHLPFRRREWAMQRFRRMNCLQKFASIHGSPYNNLNQERNLTDRQTYKERPSASVAEWQ
jgi:putative transposase